MMVSILFLRMSFLICLAEDKGMVVEGGEEVVVEEKYR